MRKLRLKGSLAMQALLLGLINAGVILLLALITMGTVYHRDLLEFMQAPVRDRILAVSRKIALDLLENGTENWDQLLKREAEGTPFHFVLLDSEGRQIAGEHTKLPASVTSFAKSGDTELTYTPRYNEFDRPDRQYSKSNLMLQRDDNSKMYWAGVHVLIHYMDENMYGHGTLIWQFPRLWTNLYFFDFLPYVLLTAGSLLITMLCWLPAVGFMLRRIRRLTNATRDIAKGNFDAALPDPGDDEVGQLTASVAIMSRQISGLLAQQQRFVSDAAHELGSPLSRLQFAVELLRTERQDARDNEEAAKISQQHLTDLAEEVSQMSELVQDLLYFSRARSGKLRVTPISLNVKSLVMSVALRENVAPEGVTVSIPTDLEIFVPETQVRRAIANLLRNARQHAGGHSVHVRASKDMNGVHIFVQDEGPGIPEQELHQVFAPFYRVEYARSRDTGGTGLGLAIVKTSIEACGGSVACRNRRPRGLEVEITLPAATRFAEAHEGPNKDFSSSSDSLPADARSLLVAR